MSKHIINHLDQVRSETLQLGEQLQAKDAEIQAMYRQVQEFNKTLREKEAMILNKEARIVELDAAVGTYREEMRRQDVLLGAREADLARLTVQLKEARAEIQQKDEHYNRVVVDNFNLIQTRYDQVAAAPYVVALQAEASKATLASAQDQAIERLRGEVTRLTAEQQAAQASLSGANAALHAAYVRIDDLGALASERGDRIDRLNAVIVSLERQTAAMRLGTAVHTAIEPLTREISERDTTIVALGRQLDDERKAAQHKLDTLNRAHSQVERDLAALRTARDTQVASLCAEITQLRASVHATSPWTYERTVYGGTWVPRGAARTYGRPEDAINPARGGIHTMESQLVHKDNTIRTHEATIASLTTERDALAARITQLSDARLMNAKAAAWGRATRLKQLVQTQGQRLESAIAAHQQLADWATQLDADAEMAAAVTPSSDPKDD